MDAKTEIREFLGSRRVRITPETAGLPTFGTGPRRVQGLRREEHAHLKDLARASQTTDLVGGGDTRRAGDQQSGSGRAALAEATT